MPTRRRRLLTPCAAASVALARLSHAGTPLPPCPILTSGCMQGRGRGGGARGSAGKGRPCATHAGAWAARRRHRPRLQQRAAGHDGLRGDHREARRRSRSRSPLRTADPGRIRTRRFRDAPSADPFAAERSQGRNRAPAQLLCSLQEMLRHTLGRHISIHIALPQGLPPLTADKGQLETVLVNLATNARDAMESGGSLTFSASAEETAMGRPGRYVRIAVTDTGTGMDSATLTRAMEPFFATKGRGEATASASRWREVLRSSRAAPFQSRASQAPAPACFFGFRSIKRRCATWRRWTMPPR